MIGTLTLPSVTSLRLSSDRRFSTAATSRSDRKMSFAGGSNCNAVIHGFTEKVRLAETRTTKPVSLYEVLQVERNASPTEIKTAYRSLAKLYHPDASDSESDGRDFIEIRNAYDTLSDPAARALYDLNLGVGSGRRPFGYSMGNRSAVYPTRRWETDQCW